MQLLRNESETLREYIDITEDKCKEVQVYLRELNHRLLQASEVSMDQICRDDGKETFMQYPV